jgi:hypothetical protein
MLHQHLTRHIFVASTDDDTMASLSDMVTGLALVTGVPEATVFAYGRFAREAGLITQRGRGRGAATMGLGDAANLLIAVGGTGVTRDAGHAIRVYRPMRGMIFDFEDSLRDMFLTWLEPLGVEIVAQDNFGTHCRLKSDFGTFTEFLINEAASGKLVELMRRIPVGEVPFELWAEWKRTNSENLHLSFDLLLDRGLLKWKPAEEVVMGEDLELALTFVRTGPRIDVEFIRMWDSAETVFQLSFEPAKRSRRGHAALRVSAQFTQDALVALGMILTNQIAPKSFNSPRRLAAIYQMQSMSSVEGTSSK